MFIAMHFVRHPVYIVDREKELAKVVVKKEDIELIVRATQMRIYIRQKYRIWYNSQVRELEISKSAAERSLREHKGNLIKALHSLTD